VVREPTELITERLVLRPLSRADIAVLMEVAESADRRQFTALLQRSIRSWKGHGFGVCVALLPASQRLMGWCGVRPDSAPEAPELFYGVATDCRGRGFATEMSRAMVSYLFSLPRVRSVWAAARADHLASIRVMQKAGLVFERQDMLDGKDCVIYRLTRASEQTPPSPSR
jgi:[ribosomal protein S5]-alanine N-acetyltransferase